MKEYFSNQKQTSESRIVPPRNRNCSSRGLKWCGSMFATPVNHICIWWSYSLDLLMLSSGPSLELPQTSDENVKKRKGKVVFTLATSVSQHFDLLTDLLLQDSRSPSGPPLDLLWFSSRPPLDLLASVWGSKPSCHSGDGDLTFSWDVSLFKAGTSQP